MAAGIDVGNLGHVEDQFFGLPAAEGFEEAVAERRAVVKIDFPMNRADDDAGLRGRRRLEVP